MTQQLTQNNYNYISQTIEYDSNSATSIPIWPSNLDSTGSFSPNWYTGDYTRNFIGFHMSGSPELLGSNMPYGALGDGAYYHGYYMQYHLQCLFAF